MCGIGCCVCSCRQRVWHCCRYFRPRHRDSVAVGYGHELQVISLSKEPHALHHTLFELWRNAFATSTPAVCQHVGCERTTSSAACCNPMILLSREAKQTSRDACILVLPQFQPLGLYTRVTVERRGMLTRGILGLKCITGALQWECLCPTSTHCMRTKAVFGTLKQPDMPCERIQQLISATHETTEGHKKHTWQELLQPSQSRQ
jgi:hypothetical protein